MRRTTVAWAWIGLAFTLPVLAAPPDDPQPLPDTAPLDWQGDLAARMVAGADKFLLRKTEQSVAGRAKHWKRDLSSADAYNASVEPNRKRLAYILGVRDALAAFESPKVPVPLPPEGYVEVTAKFKLMKYQINAIRWPVAGDLHGEGLMLFPIRETNVEPGSGSLP